MSTGIPTLTQLQRALAIAEQIERLEQELAQIMRGGAGAPAAPGPKKQGRGGKRFFSAETRAKMAAAQQARRERMRNGELPVKAGKKKKRVLSPEGRARIVAALKARHAARRKATA